MVTVSHSKNNARGPTSRPTGVFFTGCVLLAILCPVATAAPRQINLALTDIKGVPHTVEDYRGKWLVVNVWATWCATCIQELPELALFHRRHHAKDAVVLGIHYDTIATTELTAFAKKHRINFPLFAGVDAAEAAFGPVAGVPKTYLIAPDGTLRVIFDGPVTAQELEEETGTHGLNTRVNNKR